MLVVTLLFLSVLFYGDLFSYIDPGTGSFLIQLLIAFFAGSLFFAKNFFKSAKNFFVKRTFVKRTFSKRTKNIKKD